MRSNVRCGIFHKRQEPNTPTVVSATDIDRWGGVVHCNGGHVGITNARFVIGFD